MAQGEVDILFIQDFSGVRGEVIWGKLSAIEADTAQNREIPYKIPKTTYN